MTSRTVARVSLVTAASLILTACSSHATPPHQLLFTTPPADTSAPNTAAASASPTPLQHGTNNGTVYVVSSIANADGSLSVAVYPPTGARRVIKLPGYPNGATLTVAPTDTPNVGTVYAYGLASHITAIAPDGTTRTYPIKGSVINDLQIAPGGTPNAGTVYASNQDADALEVIDPAGNQSSITVGTGPGLIAIAPDDTLNAGTVYVANGYQNNDTTVSAVTPNGQVSSIDVGIAPDKLTVVPGGLPGNGTVYVTTRPSCGDCQGGIGSVAAIHPDGSVHVAEAGAHPSAVVISTAGTYAGDGYLTTGPKSSSDTTPGALLRITPDGDITTIAPTTTAGPIAAAPLGTLHNGSIYARTSSDGVTIVDPDGTTSTLTDGSTANVQIDITPTGIPGAGTVYLFADDNNHATILSPSGSRTTAAYGDASRLHFALPGSLEPGTIYYIARSTTKPRLIRIGLDSKTAVTTLPFPASDLVLAP
jgi:hypothetical protein